MADEEMAETVVFRLEAGEAYGFVLEDGRVDVGEVLSVFPGAARFLIQEADGIWMSVKAREGSKLSNIKFAAGSEHTIRVVVPHGIGGSGSEINVQARLFELFAERLIAARKVLDPSVSRAECEPLPLNEDGCLAVPEPGAFFSIRGREATLESLIKGAALMYQVSISAATVGTDIVSRWAHFNVVTGYPGAGKTTLGTHFPNLLQDFWSSGQAESSYKAVLKREEQVKFKDMLDASCQYSPCMYHSLLEWGEGALYKDEKTLGAEQILALRCLQAMLSCRDSEADYERLLSDVRSFSKNITFADVLLLFRKAMEVPEDQLIYLSFFLDEINAAQVSIPDSISWIQQILSVYVQRLRGVKEMTKVVPFMTVATTNHDANDLRLTVSEKAQHFPIPIRPLTSEEAVEVIKIFLRRLTMALGEEQFPELSSDLKQCIEFMGGRPRLLSRMIRGMLFNDSTAALSGRALWNRFREFTGKNLETTLDNVVSLAGWEHDKYRLHVGFQVILQAARVDILEVVVPRAGQVIEKNGLTWGKLEEMGLVAFEVKENNPLRVPGEATGRIRISPVLFRHMVKQGHDELCLVLPAYEVRGWRNKEKNDLWFLAFMLRSLQIIYPDRSTFSLKDVIPSSWTMRPNLLSRRFILPANVTDIIHCRSRIQDIAMLTDLRRETGYCAFLGNGNNGLDSGFILEDAKTNEVCLLVTQSKCSDDPLVKPTASAQFIQDEYEKDLWGIITDRGTTKRHQFVFRRDEHEVWKRMSYKPGQKINQRRIIYIYNTDQVIKPEERQKLLQDVKRKIIVRSDTTNVLDKFADMRHRSEFVVRSKQKFHLDSEGSVAPF